MLVVPFGKGIDPFRAFDRSPFERAFVSGSKRENAPSRTEAMATMATMASTRTRQAHVRGRFCVRSALEATKEGHTRSWGEERGVRIPCCTTSADGRKILATKDVKRGEAVLEASADAWFRDPKEPQKVMVDVADASVWRNAPEWFRIATSVLEDPEARGALQLSKATFDDVEGALGAFELLLGLVEGPEDEANPLRSAMEGTQALAMVDASRNRTHALVESAFTEAPASTSEFLAVRAACLDVEESGKPALVPLVHLADHQRGDGANAQLVIKGGWFGARVQLVATKEIPREQSICIDWDQGQGRGDSRLFAQHGVMDTRAPRGTFEIGLSIPKDDPFCEDKMDVLEIAGFSGEGVTFSIQEGELPSEDLRTMLRLIHLGGTDAFLLEALFRDQVWELISLPVSRENEAMACASIVQALEQALESYPTTFEEDFALLAKGQVQEGSALEIAIRLRMGEKQALQTGIQFFNGVLDELDEIEYYQERRLKRLGLLNDDGGSTFEDFFR